METYITAKGREMEDSQVALFIDFENVAISAEEMFDRLDTGKLIETAEKFGRCITRRAYGDWTRFSKYSQDLLEHAIEAIQLFHYGAHNTKNAADIQMVADILEMLFMHPDIDVYVLATGDSDFSAVARKLRSYSKRVIGIGLKQATSDVLVKACDQFLIYDTLVEPHTRTQSYSLEQARQLLLETMRELMSANGGLPVLAGRLKHDMLKKDSTFSQEKLGFPQFRDFLAEQQDMVELGMRDNQVVVALNPAVAEKASSDPALEYRKALELEGLSLLDPTTRTDVLRDLFSLLRKYPGKYTLESAETYLKSNYDATNVLRDRKEVRDAIRLVRFSGAIFPVPQSWELDPLTIKPGLDSYGFIDLCESAYVAALMARNLPIETETVSRLLFGTTDKQSRVTHLVGLASASRESKQTGRAKKARSWQLPSRLTASVRLKPILKDLEDCEVEGEITLERALRASEEGMKARVDNFELAKQYYLQSARMIYTLLQNESPGASLVDLEWQLCSYCAAAAGAAYSSREYPTAVEYYLAFFSIVVETEPVWEKVKSMVPAMLSYYFSNAATLESVSLDVAPGHKHPAFMASLVLNHPSPEVQQRAVELMRKMAEINPAVLRKVIQRLEAMAHEGNGEEKQEAKAAEVMLGILNEAGLPQWLVQ